jgi:hypothetical protein
VQHTQAADKVNPVFLRGNQWQWHHRSMGLIAKKIISCLSPRLLLAMEVSVVSKLIIYFLGGSTYIRFTPIIFEQYTI